MEIKFKGDYSAKNRLYAVGTVNVLSGYAMQILELRPRLEEGKLAPGEQVRMLFGISKEEYDLKDTDEKALAELAEQMRRSVPRDRFLGCVVMDLTGKPVAKQIRPQMGESIDNGAFIAKYVPKPGPIDAQLSAAQTLQLTAMQKNAPAGVREDWNHARKEAAAALLELERFWSPVDKLLGSRFPYVREGRVEIFTTRERAEKAMLISNKLNFGEEAWEIREIEKESFGSFFDRCAEMGLSGIRIDAASKETQIFISDASERETPRNAVLRGCILQEKACGLQWQRLQKEQLTEPDRRRLLERLMTLRNFTLRETGNAVLWCICGIQTANALEMGTKAAFEKLDSPAGMKVIAVNNFIQLGDKNNNEQFMALFTSRIRATAFAEKLNGAPYPVAVTFDDVKELLDKNDRLTGVILDADDLGYRIPKAQFSAVMDLREKPRQIVKLKAPEAPAAESRPDESKQSAPSSDPEAGSLPDPDAFDVPAQKKIKAADNNADTESSEETHSNQKEKGGFFRRLFGKDKK